MTNEVYEKQLTELSKFVNGDMKKIIESQREAIHMIEIRREINETQK